MEVLHVVGEATSFLSQSVRDEAVPQHTERETFHPFHHTRLIDLDGNHTHSLDLRPSTGRHHCVLSSSMYLGDAVPAEGR